MTKNSDYELNDRFVQIVEWESSREFELIFDEPLSDAIIYVENFGMPLVEIDLYEKNQCVNSDSFIQFNYVDYYIHPQMNIDKVVIRYEDELETGSSVNVYVAYNASVVEAELYQKRVKDSFENVKFEGDRIITDITLSKDNYIYTQIPYDSGWKAYCDGQETEVLKANGGFCAIKLLEGNHKVEFDYDVSWLKEGMMVSLISLVICLVYFCFEKNASIGK